MKSLSLMLLLGSFLTLGAGLGPVNSAKVTMTGQYEWTQNKGKPGGIRAEFAQVKEGEWDVAFFFRFNGENHVYRGTAMGNLTDGALQGEVQNEKKNRTWRFRGQVRGGHFQGTHVEINRRGREQATGTIELKASND